MTISARIALASLCVAVPLIVPVGVKADPKVLTGSQLGTVTAGFTLVLPIVVQTNVNATGQAAVATSVAVAVCAVCDNPTVAAFAPSTAFNINVAELTNFAN